MPGLDTWISLAALLSHYSAAANVIISKSGYSCQGKSLDASTLASWAWDQGDSIGGAYSCGSEYVTVPDGSHDGRLISGQVEPYVYVYGFKYGDSGDIYACTEKSFYNNGGSDTICS